MASSSLESRARWWSECCRLGPLEKSEGASVPGIQTCCLGCGGGSCTNRNGQEVAGTGAPGLPGSPSSCAALEQVRLSAVQLEGLARMEPRARWALRAAMSCGSIGKVRSETHHHLLFVKCTRAHRLRPAVGATHLRVHHFQNK